MPLRPTKVVVFGNPKVGTKLMQDSQAAALDLPLRVSIWEDARGRVWVGYRSMDASPPNTSSRISDGGHHDAHARRRGGPYRQCLRLLSGFCCLAAGSYGYLPAMPTTSEPGCRRTLAALLALAFLAAGPAWAQQPGGAPPAVGVVPATRQPVTQSTEYIGRIQATNRVNLVARVSAYLDEVLFTEGTEVKKGDLLYRLEQGPFRADVQAKEASVAQFKAQLQNAAGRARPQPERCSRRRPASKRPSTSRSANRAGAEGPDAGRRGAAPAGAHQPRLHRDQGADRRQDRPHRGHRRQLCQPQHRHPGVDRQPGSDVRRLPGADAHGDRAAAAQRRHGRTPSSSASACPTAASTTRPGGSTSSTTR